MKVKFDFSSPESNHPFISGQTFLRYMITERDEIFMYGNVNPKPLLPIKNHHTGLGLRVGTETPYSIYVKGVPKNNNPRP